MSSLAKAKPRIELSTVSNSRIAVGLQPTRPTTMAGDRAFIHASSINRCVSPSKHSPGDIYKTFIITEAENIFISSFTPCGLALRSIGIDHFRSSALLCWLPERSTNSHFDQFVIIPTKSIVNHRIVVPFSLAE